MLKESLEKIYKAIEEYSEQGSIKKACENQGVSVTLFYKARSEYPLIARLYDSARKLRADVLADEIVEISDKNENPHALRVRIDARKWVCGVFNREVYGDKVDLNVKGMIDLRAAIDGARNRTRILSDPIEDVDFEDVESIEGPNQNSTDKESDGSEIFK